MKYLSRTGISLLVLAVLTMLCHSPTLADTVVSGNTVLNIGNTGYYGPVTAEDNATVNYLGSSLSTTIGGNPSFNITGLDYSTINILYPANLSGQAVAFGNSTVNILDTIPASVAGYEPDGGSIGDQYFVGQSGTLNLSGIGVTLTLLGKNWYYDYGLNAWFDRYQLTGTTPDGWPFAPPGSPNSGTIVWVEDTGLPTLTFQVKVNGTTVIGAGMLSSLMSSSTVSGGTVLNGTVTLSGPVSTDTVVGLSSSDSAKVRLHRAVIIPAGSQSATFVINTYRSHVTKTVTLQASLGPVVQTEDLTITGR